MANLSQRTVQEITIEAKAGARTWWSESVGTLGSGLDEHTKKSAKMKNLPVSIRFPTDLEIGADAVATQRWHSSTLLSQLLISLPELVSGKTVLELGAGFHGIVALSACHGGAASMLSTDLDESAVRLCQLNLDSNQPHCAVAGLLDYCRLDHSMLGHFDVVLAADVIYSRNMAKPLVCAIQRFLMPGGLALIVCPRSAAREGMEELWPQLQMAADLSCILTPIDLPFSRAGKLYDCYTVRSLRHAKVCLDVLD